MMLIGLLAVVISNIPLFSSQVTVNWDALDSIWPFMRWYGSALRSGYFPDFFPNIFSGFPVGSEILVGPYNVMYLGLAYAFPNSTLSINLVYLTTQILIYLIAYGIGKSYRFDPVVNMAFGLSIVASGYVIGHASHFSHLQAAVSLMGCFLSMRLAQTGSAKSAALIMFLAVYHACTSAYVQDIVFGAQLLIPYWAYIYYVKKDTRRSMGIVLLAGLLGLLISSPSILHFYSLFSQSLRYGGQSPEGAMQGSLSTSSLLNFFYPIWRMGYGEPTMERFHLLFGSTLFILLGFLYAIYRKIDRNKILLLLFFAFILILLALGKNSIFPLRMWLAENFYIYRTGKYPSAEHRGIALFLLGLISAFGLNWLFQKFQKLKLWFFLAILVDFISVKYFLSEYQYHNIPVGQIKNPVELFQVEFGPADQHLIDRPRNCNKTLDNITAIVIERNLLAPSNFYWSGYESMSNAKYENEKIEFSSIICGPSRLWNSSDLSSRNYQLKLYSPSKIIFEVGDGGNSSNASKLIWSDVYDQFWELTINGKSAAIEAGPANLRVFTAKSGDLITMIYRGPLTRIWR